jgi:hypothetical protein
MLGNLLAFLDLWSLLWSDPYAKVLEQLGTHLLSSFSGFRTLGHPHPRLAFVTTFVAGPPPDEPEALGLPHDIAFERYLHDFRPNERVGSDPIFTLSRISLPRDLEAPFEKDLEGRVSLYRALAAFMGAPGEFGGNKRIIELVLFAAACIVGPDTGQPLPSWHNRVWYLDRMCRLRKYFAWQFGQIQAPSPPRSPASSRPASPHRAPRWQARAASSLS